MKETQINWKSTDKEIENMTYNQAIEILKNQIKLGKTKGNFRPRKHLTKALELAVKAMTDIQN